VNSDPYCICGHTDSHHFCSTKRHDKARPHDCSKGPNFCDGEDINDPPRSCSCRIFRFDNLKFLEQLSGPTIPL
jgi:hypothetical protein